MTSRTTHILRLLRRFPRGHLAVTLILATATGVFMAVPQSGSSLTEMPGPRPLALPDPAAGETAHAPEPGKEPKQPRHDWTELQVQRGDNLVELLGSQGVSMQTIHRLISKHEKLAGLSNIRPGERLRVAVAEGGRLEALQYKPDKRHTLSAEHTEQGWRVREQRRDFERQLQYAQGTIESSLFVAGQEAGMTDQLTMQLANIFGWDIDFILDIRRGDSFQVLYEELYLDGEKVRNGNILMAKFRNGDREFTAYRYRMDDGTVDYLDPQGQSVRKEFIRTPVAFTRISSGFSLGRKHPVLNRVRKHEGVDYAAPTGTPVKASGDGKVVFAGRKGGYGNVIELRHGQKYSTLYAHLNRFARGIHEGERVEQKEVIAYVGATGLATGPHLHYEFRVNGVHRNPLAVDLPEAGGVPADERREFLVHASRLNNQFALRAEAFQVAQNSSP